MRSTLLTLPLLTLLCCALILPAGAQARSCGHFIIGKANSSVYSGGKLPAHGSASGASCSTLRRIARRLHSGTYKVPDGKRGLGAYGSPFTVTDQGRGWSCRLGASGPSYKLRCRSGDARLAWQAGQ